MTLNYGKALPKGERNSNGDVPLYGANGIKEFSDQALSHGPSLIIGRKGSAGEINRVDGPFWPLDVTYFTTHDDERVDFDFLEHALRMMDLPSLAKGVKPGINRNEVYALRLALPLLEKQRRIVAVLDQAFAAVDRARALAEANLADAEELLERVIADLFEHEAAVVSTLGDVCQIKSGAGFPHKDQGRKTGEFPFYKVSDMNLPGNEWTLNHANNYIDEPTRRRLRAAVLPRGAIVFPKVGGAIATNKKRVIETPGCVDNNVMGLVPWEGEIEPGYLHQWLYATDIYEFSNKANPPSITQGTVLGWPIPIPPIEAQREIVGKIGALRKSITRLADTYDAELRDLDNFQQSLLQKAFAGELI